MSRRAMRTARRDKSGRILSIREIRDRYAIEHAGNDPRPSRFADHGRSYREWANRADAWGEHL